MFTLQLQLALRATLVAIICALLVMCSGLVLQVNAADPAAIDTDPLIEAALKVGCRGNKASRAMMEELFRIEAEAGIKGEARGLVAAAACNESGFNPKALGDWFKIGMPHTRENRCKNYQRGCTPTSFGLMQFKPWAKKHIRKYASNPKMKEPRFDWRASAKYWALHVVAQIPRVKRECRYTEEIDIWRAAHRTAITKSKCVRYRVSKRTGKQRCAKFVPRCHRIDKVYKSSHWRILGTFKAKASGKDPFPGIPRAVRAAKAKAN